MFVYGFFIDSVRAGRGNMEDINARIAKAEEEIRQLRNKKRRLLNQKKNEERKARTHRLIERGAILESLLERPEQYENEQIKGLLEVALRSAQARERLGKTMGEREEGWPSLVHKGALIHLAGACALRGLLQRAWPPQGSQWGSRDPLRVMPCPHCGLCGQAPSLLKVRLSAKSGRSA